MSAMKDLWIELDDLEVDLALAGKRLAAGQSFVAQQLIEKVRQRLEAILQRGRPRQPVKIDGNIRYDPRG